MSTRHIRPEDVTAVHGCAYFPVMSSEQQHSIASARASKASTPASKPLCSLRVWLASAVVLFLVSVPQLAAQECEPPSNARDQWQLPLPSDSEWPDEIGEPVSITQTTEDVPASEGELAAIGDMHVLFDVPLRGFVEVLNNLDEHDEFFPRLAEAELICAESTPLSYANVRHYLSFKFLFFGNDYEYRVHIFVENNEEDGSYRQWWVLDESLDGQIASVSGSWFLSTVTRGGETYTYARYVTRTVFAETVLGLKTAFNRFGVRDLSRMMEALREQAVTQISGAQ